MDLILFLASGQADVLSGRFISVGDDVNELVRRIEEIQRADLYTLQLLNFYTFVCQLIRPQTSG